jgi:hemerythrin-like domain-containing protein
MEYILDICNKLHDDHMTTISLMERIETALPRLGRKSPPDVGDAGLSSLLSDLFVAMQNEVTSHFAFEEENLFTRIEAMGETPMIHMLRGEHEIIRPMAAELMQSVTAARSDGFTPESWAAFYDLGLDLAERETFHIQKEEMGFLPLLEQIIDEDDDKQLCRDYDANRGG